MRITLTLVALSASCIEVQGSVRLIRQQGVHVPQPPPPPAIYDPIAGPFIISLNEEGDVEEHWRAIVANAMANWSGPTLQAFVICSSSPSDHVDRMPAIDALKIVSQELKARGAQTVVMPPGGVCAPSSARPNSKGAYIEILGVVRI